MTIGTFIGILVGVYLIKKSMNEKIRVLETRVSRLRREKEGHLEMISQLKEENDKLRAKLS